MARRTPPPWFQSTHSLRSATLQGHCRSQDFQVSIHALLAECDRWHVPHLITLLVSIHALLAECDRVRQLTCPQTHCFNPRTPCGVRRHSWPLVFLRTRFNPRTPCGVRPLTHVLFSFLLFQSTHSLRSATRLSITPESLPPVSIHALLAECDCYFRPQATLYNLFQSTHSLRSATMLSSKCPFVMFVSIHALLAECDFPKCAEKSSSHQFQSTHSLRSATLNLTLTGIYGRFQSTHSLRSATVQDAADRVQVVVSIHALLAECDMRATGKFAGPAMFQSTHSLRSAT